MISLKSFYTIKKLLIDVKNTKIDLKYCKTKIICQSIPQNTHFTQKINIQLKDFLKNYKYEKLLNNYKEFNYIPSIYKKGLGYYKMRKANFIKSTQNLTNNKLSSLSKKWSVDHYASDTGFISLNQDIPLKDKVMSLTLQSLTENKSKKATRPNFDTDFAKKKEKKNTTFFLNDKISISKPNKLKTAQTSPKMLETWSNLIITLYHNKQKNNKRKFFNKISHNSLFLTRLSWAKLFLVSDSKNPNSNSFFQQPSSVLLFSSLASDNLRANPKWGLVTPSKNKANFICHNSLYTEKQTYINIYMFPKPTYSFLQILLEKYLEMPNYSLEDFDKGLFKKSECNPLCSSMSPSLKEKVIMPFNNSKIKSVKINNILQSATFLNKAMLSLLCLDTQKSLNKPSHEQKRLYNPFFKQSPTELSSQNIIKFAPLPKQKQSLPYYSGLFNKINKKTFLSYWLIPIAGFALMTPKNFDVHVPVLNLYNSKILSDKFKKFKSLSKKEGLESYTSHTGFIDINQDITLNDKVLSQTRKKTKANQVYYYMPQLNLNLLDNQFLPIKTIFNCLYNYVKISPYNIKALPCLENQHEIISIFKKAPFLKNKHNTKVQFPHWLVRDSCFLADNLLLTNLIDASRTINPLYSSKIVKKNLNFIDESMLTENRIMQHYASQINNKAKMSNLLFVSCGWQNPHGSQSKKSLKLLKQKILKLNKGNLVKLALPSSTWPLLTKLTALYNSKKSLVLYKTLNNQILPLRLKPSVLDYSFLKKHTPFNSYQESLNIINLSLKHIKNVFNVVNNKVVYTQNNSNTGPSAQDLTLKDKVLSLNTNLTPFEVSLQLIISKVKQSNIIKKDKHDKQNKQYIKNKNKLLSNYFEKYNRTNQLFLSNISGSNKIFSPIKYANSMPIKPTSCFVINNFISTNNKLKPKPLKLNFNLIHALEQPQDFYKTNNNLLTCLYKTKHIGPSTQDITNVYKVMSPSPLRLQSLYKKVGLLYYTLLTKPSSYYKVNKKSSKQSTPFFNTKLHLRLASLSSLLSHQKMFKINTNNITNNNYKYMQEKLSLQKKRKAKKQRQETRRQKKRIRFFPRPIWLRYRMFLMTIQQRKLCQNNRMYNSKMSKAALLNSKVFTNYHSYTVQRNKAKFMLLTKEHIDNKAFKFQKNITKSAYLSAVKQETQLKLLSLLQWNPLKKLLISNKKEKNILFKNTKLYYSKNKQLKIRYSLKKSIIKFQGIKKYLKTKAMNLSNIKIKANYSNFKNEKKNNTSPNNNFKTNDKDTLFRAFWIKTYNNPLTNNYLPVKWFVSNKTNFKVLKSLTNFKNHNTLSLSRFDSNGLDASFNKSLSLLSKVTQQTNANLRTNPEWSLVTMAQHSSLYNFFSQFSNSNNFMFLLGCQNQSSKSHFGFKSLYKKGAWFSKSFFKPTLSQLAFIKQKQKHPVIIKNTHNQYRNIIRIKWALTKTNNTSITNNSKRYVLWGTQKLRNQSKNNKTKCFEKQLITSWENFFLNKNLNLFSKKISNKLIEKKQKLLFLTHYKVMSPPLKATHQNSIFKLKHIKLFNNDNVLPLIKVTDQISFSSVTNQKQLNNSLTGFLTKQTHFLAENKYLRLSLCIFLHLCALISLVSISQVRCFVKFHLLLLYKLSNVYNILIQKISTSGVFKKYISSYYKVGTQLYNMKNNVVPLKSNISLDKTWLALANQVLLQKKQYNLNKQKELYFIKTNFIQRNKILSNKFFDLKKLLKKYNLSTISSTNSVTKKSDLLLTSFSLQLLKKENKKQDADLLWLEKNKSFSKTNHIQKSNSKYSNYKLIKSLYKKGGLVDLSQPSSNLPAKIINKNKFSKLNIVSGKSLFLRLWHIVPQYATFNFIPQARFPFRILNKYIQHQKMFYFKKSTTNLVKVSKMRISHINNKLINIFQHFVRATTKFLDQPFELTSKWIAFGFLIEWSSDLITTIPENIDIYVWNSFYKLIRIMPIKNLIHFNVETSLLLLNNVGFNTTLVFYPFDYFFNNKIAEVTNYKTQKAYNPVNQNFILLTISHLFYRRILHLIYLLIETISQPDTDLISRQEKGTLFWDNWADFLVTAAEYYNLNIAALSTIKAEQNLLIEKMSNDFGLWLKRKTLPAKYHYLANTNKQACGYPTSIASLGKASLFKNINNLNINKIYKVRPKSKSQNIVLDKNLISAQLLYNINDRWSVTQYVPYQSGNNGKNSSGDLFIDFHPPKAFLHIPTIKYNKILQQPIGTLVCQINAGIFNKQISKNLLLVNMNRVKGVNNNAGQHADYNVLLLQALAGETELKIIRDNAHRYTLVNHGVAIGIKLLKDVFFAIALNTPCIFLLEDIHAIGERRPMLISDYDSAPGSNLLLHAERDEVHEKNQVVYQLTRHVITHYKKPFKGDYSLTIPTNLYSLDLFLKQPAQSTSNLSLIHQHNLTIKNKIKKKSQGSLSSKKRLTSDSSFISLGTGKNIKLKKANNKSLMPPSTSPFSVLLLKDEKTIKPNKIVEEIAWTGVSGSSSELQDFQGNYTKTDETKPRISYSVRAKVALLAELSFSNISAKLDMINDLLVIIDSVRSNKGFVVFATTNIPHVLDPALRRPGRFDETICLPSINTSDVLNFNTNYEMLKFIKPNFNLLNRAALKISPNPIQGILLNNDLLGKVFFNYPIINSKFRLKILDTLQTTKTQEKGLSQYLNLTVNFKDYNTILKLKNKQTQSTDPFSLNNALISFSKKRKEQTNSNQVKTFNYVSGFCLDSVDNVNYVLSRRGKLDQIKIGLRKAHFNQKKQSCIAPLCLEPTNVYLDGNLQANQRINSLRMCEKINFLSFKTIAYYEVGKVMLQYYLINNNQYKSKISSVFSVDNTLNIKSINYLSLFALKNKFLLQLMLIFGGKVSQLLCQKNNLISKKALEPSCATQRFGYITSHSHIFEGNENLRLATSLMLSFIHKRYLYLKNLIVPRLLNFTDGTVLEEPGGPPFSNLLIPAKRFENYKRVFRDSIVGDTMGQNNGQISLFEKQQYHTQLYKIKQLNNQLISQKELVPIKINQTFVENSSLQTTTNINWYYQNLLLKRHGQYLTNQWWNGQLSEHNTEMVFLSDIDWRSSFIKQKQNNLIKSKNLFTLLQHKKGSGESDILCLFKKSQSIGYDSVAATDTKTTSVFSQDFIKTLNKQKTQNIMPQCGVTGVTPRTKIKKPYNSTDGLDILLDFPDTDQYYNPRRRRWLLNKGYWSFWFNFDKVYTEEIISTWLLESVIQTYTYLHNNTELLDFITNKFIVLGYPNNKNLNINTSNNLATNFDMLKNPSQKQNFVFDYSKTELSSVKEIFITNCFKRF